MKIGKEIHHDMYKPLFPGERNGNLFQYSCLENPMDRGAWQATVCGVARVRHDWATKLLFSSVHFSRSVMSHSLQPHGVATRQASLSISNVWSWLKLLSIESVMPPNHLTLGHSLLLLPLIFPSIRVFSKELTLPIRWSKIWSFSFSISPSNEYSRLISFRTDWFDLLALPGTLKSLLQHHNLKASVL